MFRAKKISVSKGELNEALYQLDDAKKALYASDQERAVAILNVVDSQLNKLLSDPNVLDLENVFNGQEKVH